MNAEVFCVMELRCITQFSYHREFPGYCMGKGVFFVSEESVNRA
jgi:hypothetical protein